MSFVTCGGWKSSRWTIRPVIQQLAENQTITCSCLRVCFLRNVCRRPRRPMASRSWPEANTNLTGGHFREGLKSVLFNLFCGQNPFTMTEEPLQLGFKFTHLSLDPRPFISRRVTHLYLYWIHILNGWFWIIWSTILLFQRCFFPLLCHKIVA